MAAFEVLAQVARRNPAAAPARSLRRSTARRASIRRASARRRQSDSEARIIGFLVRHPESTIGDLAKSLNLDPDHVAIDLTQLTSTGEIKRASHGYSIQPPSGSPAE
jgi:DNA-binding MarR family transcriptional regulator